MANFIANKILDKIKYIKKILCTLKKKKKLGE